MTLSISCHVYFFWRETCSCCRQGCITTARNKEARILKSMRNKHIVVMKAVCEDPLAMMPGGVRHDPQRIMGKTVTVPYFNRDTVEFASRKRNESNPGIKTLLPFLKNITEESDLENFQDLIVAYWLHKTISISLSRFGDDRAI